MTVAPQQAPRLLRECRDLFAADLDELFEELGPRVAEELSRLVESTRDERRKTDYLRLRNDLQARWEVLTSAFGEELATQLERQAAPATRADEPDLADLQLVSEEELAEQIVLREFVSRVAEACSEEIYALDRRIGHLLDKEELAEGDNPFAPPVVCAAVRAGCAALYEEVDAFSTLLRQLERHLRDELPQLYRSLNERLIEADILPTLKRSYRPAQRSRADAAEEPANILGTLQRLVADRVGAGGGTGGSSSGAAGGGGVPTATEAAAASAALFQSLEQLQADLRAAPAADDGELTNLIQQVRERGAGQRVAPLEAITLDIVAMLFDLIFEDDKLPGSIKGLISRLQIPILKLAMRDQQFFANRSHPARRFLDSISGIAIRWGKQVDEGDPFYRKLDELVERIHDGFDRDAEVFAQAIDELAAFVTAHEAADAAAAQQMATAAEHAVVEAGARRERGAQAAKEADEALAGLIGGEPPKLIAQFLHKHWRTVLHELGARHGPASDSFKAALRIATELVWSVAPKREPEERKRQVALLPKLVAGIKQGLDRIQLPLEAQQAFMDALQTLQMAALRGESRRKIAAATLPPAAEVEAPKPVLEVARTVENGVHLEQVVMAPDAVAAPKPDRALLRKIKHLVRGDWVEFVAPDEATHRERLTWISPNRSLLLFSNHAAKCAISITPDALAHRLSEGSARLVEHEAAVFERALDGALKAMEKPKV